MKKIIITLLVFIITITSTSFVSKSVDTKEFEKNYAQTFVVTKITDNEVICVDFNGNKWSFTDDAEDWLVGDLVSAIMSDNGTKIIYDDYFVSVRYSGWVDGLWGYDESTGNPILVFEW